MSGRRGSHGRGKGPRGSRGNSGGSALFEPGHPDHPIEALREVIDDWEAFQHALTQPDPTVIRTNLLRITREALAKRLAAHGFATRPIEGMPAFLEVTDQTPGPISDSLEHWLGLFYMQQSATGLAAPILDPQPGDTVLDLCAAPGGKTTHLAEHMGGEGTVVCADINEGRIRALLGNIYRMGHTNIMVMAADSRNFPTGPMFDRVMVDVPCSAQGTLRKRMGKMPRRSKGFAKQIAKTQAKILKRAIQLTRPGGTLLYVTCTFDPLENEAVLTKVLEKSPVEVDRIELDVPHARGVTRFGEIEYDPRLEGAVRIYPHHLNSGGLFMCRMIRADDGSDGVEGAGAVGEGVPETEGQRALSPGWTPVPKAFPGEDFTEADVEQDIANSERVLDELLGIDPETFGASWMRRGTNLWAHNLPAWPAESWETGARWRVVALGLRAMDVSGVVPRPSNDLIVRWADRVSKRVLDLPVETWDDLLSGRRVENTEYEGRVTLALHGEPIARGFIRDGDLQHEVPKGRLRWLVSTVGQHMAERAAE